jgi:predicted RNA-binding Zn-ribbon protein involved in translation (DUF1610 family)
MTVRPHGQSYVLACDNCGAERPVARIEDVRDAIRDDGWQAMLPVFGRSHHSCPRCAGTED